MLADDGNVFDPINKNDILNPNIVMDQNTKSTAFQERYPALAKMLVNDPRKRQNKDVIGAPLTERETLIAKALGAANPATRANGLTPGFVELESPAFSLLNQSVAQDTSLSIRVGFWPPRLTVPRILVPLARAQGRARSIRQLGSGNGVARS